MSQPGGEPVQWACEKAIETLIKAISVSDNYWYNWHTTNQDNEALCTFPCAMIDISSEESIDGDYDVNAHQSYSCRLPFTLKVVGKMPEISNTAQYDIKKILWRCLDDLKKCFGNNPTLTSRGGLILYRGSDIVTSKSNGVIIPSSIQTRWIIDFKQDRTEPSNCGEV